MLRVAKRVSQGGHSIPEDAIRGRSQAGLWNTRHLYLPLAADVTILANRDNGLRLIARRVAFSELKIFDEEIWARIKEQTEWAS